MDVPHGALICNVLIDFLICIVLAWHPLIPLTAPFKSLTNWTPNKVKEFHPVVNGDLYYVDTSLSFDRSYL